MINLVTISNIAKRTGRTPSNVTDSYRRKLLPKPDFTVNGRTPLWYEETIAPYIEKENEK